MKEYKRVFLIVTDSLGIGPDRDQDAWNDTGAHTLLHVSEHEDFEIDIWKKMGIGKIANLAHKWVVKKPIAYVAQVQELSHAKDTLAGHWEMMGVKTEVPFPTFAENGFPDELIKELSKAFDNRPIVGNKAVSGTEIINELALVEKDQKGVIVYTSFDSVLQICGHEEWMGLETLYTYAKRARAICSSRPEWNVGRIIARPYIGEEGNYTRTFNRHDYAIKPPRTILNDLQEAGVKVIAIGKINDIFSAQGIDQSIHSGSDNAGMDITIDLASKKAQEKTLIFTNLVEFDSSYGHRRNVAGYANNVRAFDIKLAKFVNAMQDDDLLLITSDHGNDPSFRGYNHTRELLPLTIYAKDLLKPKMLERVEGLMTVGKLILKNFKIKDTYQNGDDIFDLIK